MNRKPNILRRVVGPLMTVLSISVTLLVSAAENSPATPAGAGPASWPMFRGSQGLLGVSASRLPDKLVLLWTFKTLGPVKSSPAIDGGPVFVGSNDTNIYALD